MTQKEIINLINKKRKTIGDVRKKINKELDNRYVAEINKIIKRAINDFYGTFKPDFYKRKYSLRTMYKVTSENGNVNMTFKGSFSKVSHRLDNEKIFDLVFMEGYHGGAKGIHPSKVESWGEHPSTGTPYWRRPPKPWEDEEGKLHPPYTEWGRKAKQDESPMERIEKALEIYYEKKEPLIQNEVIDIELEKWLLR